MMQVVVIQYIVKKKSGFLICTQNNFFPLVLIIRIPPMFCIGCIKGSLKTDGFHKMLKLSSFKYFLGSAPRIIY